MGMSPENTEIVSPTPITLKPSEAEQDAAQEIPEEVHEAAAELARRLLSQPPQDG